MEVELRSKMSHWPKISHKYRKNIYLLLPLIKNSLLQIRASKNYTIPMILVQRVDFEKVQELLKYQPHDQRVKISLSENEFKETKVNDISSLKLIVN